ncbi:MAG: hypothetical protein AB8H79_24155 [Myxococcota bacterium]
MTTVRFYFDVISPYAWLAWKRIEALCDEEGAELVPVPGALWGDVAPPRPTWSGGDSRQA